MAESLKTKAISGMIWNAIQRFGTMGISFISSIVLARLLSPDDYGCIGMLLIFTALAETFIDGGFGSALIQKKTPTQQDYSTVFYWNLFLSVFLYGVLFVSAPAIARFYKIPLLCSVLRVQGVGIIISALSIVQNNQLRKQLQFKKLATIGIIATIVSVAVAIVMALKGKGVWSLVAQQLSRNVVTMLLLWFTSKWRLTFEFSKQSFKELFGFGSFILFSNLLNTFCNNIQGLLIGRFFSPATMGMYSQARKLEMLASTSISSIVDTVSYPVLSSVQNDIPRLRNTIRKFILLLAFICFPLIALFAVVAEPVVVLLYSEKWLPCVPYLQILCVAGIAICLQGVNYYGIAAIGKSRDLFKWTIVKRILGIVFIVVGLYVWGMYGLLVGCVLGSYAIYIINAYLTSKHIGYKLWNQFLDFVPIMLLTVVAALVAFVLGRIISLHIYVVAFIQIIAFVALYLCASFVLKLESYRIFKESALELLNRNKSSK